MSATGVSATGTSNRLWWCGLLPSLCGLAVTVVLALTPVVGVAQTSPDPTGQRATRVQLTQRVSTLESQLQGSSLRGDARTKAAAEVAAIKLRLQQGDFRVGDRFVFSVRQDSVRSDTASVRDSLMVSIMTLPDVSLSGVLRSELDEKISSHVARFLRNASVRTNALTRVAILGAVRTPGFYYVAPDRPLSDLVMMAGGPTEIANLNEIEVSRGTSKTLSAKNSKKLLKEGRTIEQIDVQSGDEVRIPAKRKINWQAIIQLFFVLSSLTFAFISFLQWYYDRQDA